MVSQLQMLDGLPTTTQFEDAFRRDGAVLIKKAASTVRNFEHLTRKWCDRFRSPASRSAYQNFAAVDGDGYTSAVMGTALLLAHSETAYSPNATPDIGMLYSADDLVDGGGQTFLLDGLAMARAMSRPLAEKFASLGITYAMTWPKSRWQIELGVNTNEQLESYLSARQDCIWEIDGEQQLHLRFSTHCFLRLKESRELAFTNGILAHLPRVIHPRYAPTGLAGNPLNQVTFGDSSLLNDDELAELLELQDKLMIPHKWCAGDILVFDNHRWMHGRLPYAGEAPRCLYSRFGFRD